MNDNDIIRSTRNWLESIVIGLNLCPFAKRELVKNRIRFSVSSAETEEQLLSDLEKELLLLNRDDSVETCLLIHPKVLTDFYEYNQFLDYAEGLLEQMSLVGIYQIASFHPDYQFGGTNPDDAENYTNRSPYPVLHLLREDSVEQAVLSYPDIDSVPDNNVELIKNMGDEKLKNMLKACFI